MEPALLYVRFSPRPSPEEARSLEVQLERLHGYCHMAGLSPDHIIRDPETSARKVPLDQRDGGKEALRLINSGVRHLVCQRVDRLFRDAADGLHWVKKWRKRRVALHLADQGGCAVNTSTTFGYFMFGQLVLTAEVEAMMTAERTSGAMRFHQSNGRRMSDRVQYGYMPDPADPSRLIQCPEEQGHIVEIRALHGQGLTLRGICRELTERGIKCRNNGWRHGLIKRILERDTSSRM